MSEDELRELEQLATELESVGRKYAGFLNAKQRAKVKRAVELTRKAAQQLRR